MTQNLEATLAERGARYGDFTGHAQISQGLQAVMHRAYTWGSMSADKREALTIIAHKIARILNGDPSYADSWHDIAGYAKLAEERCTQAPAHGVGLRPGGSPPPAGTERPEMVSAIGEIYAAGEIGSFMSHPSRT